jgi:hypothetical protein
MKSILKKLFGFLIKRLIGGSYSREKYYKRPKKKGLKGILKKYLD